MNQITQPTTETRTIAGHDITLTTGKNYIASRSMAFRGRKSYPITIYIHNGDGLGWDPILTLAPMTYAAANDFLNAFNNGPTSFDGRVW